MTSWSLTARHVFPVDGPPLANGIVVIADDKIVAIEPHGTRTADVDLGNVAVLPGLVNAHTHLDLTGLRGKCPPTADFTQWLRGVIAHRRSEPREKVNADILLGLEDSIAAGTTLVGDIAEYGHSWHFLKNAPMRAVVFWELIGLSEVRANKAFDDYCLWHKVIPSLVLVETMRLGISPHAPYSVHHSIFYRAVWANAILSTRQNTAVTVHLAETRAEIQLLAEHCGPFVGMLQELAAWSPEGLVQSPEEVLEFTKGLCPVLYAHCNYLRADAPVPVNGSIVYCPRTHAAFGHPPHPFRAFLQRGVRVALGTDSLASNPDLSILAEMRFIHERYPDFPTDTLLRMGTLSGAEALGWADETGSLTPGKSADLVVVPLPNEEGDPYELLFASSQPVARTMFRGHWVWPAS